MMSMISWCAVLSRRSWLCWCPCWTCSNSRSLYTVLPSTCTSNTSLISLQRWEMAKCAALYSSTSNCTWVEQRRKRKRKRKRREEKGRIHIAIQSRIFPTGFICTLHLVYLTEHITQEAHHFQLLIHMPHAKSKETGLILKVSIS